METPADFFDRKEHQQKLLAAGLIEIKRMDTRIYYTANKAILKEILERSKKLLTGED